MFEFSFSPPYGKTLAIINLYVVGVWTYKLTIKYHVHFGKSKDIKNSLPKKKYKYKHQKDMYFNFSREFTVV